MEPVREGRADGGRGGAGGGRGGALPPPPPSERQLQQRQRAPRRGKRREELLLCADFNQDGTCMALGCSASWAIFNCYPYRRRLRVESDGIGLCRMLFCTSLVVLVGSGTQPGSSPRKLRLYNSTRSEVLCELNFVSSILAVEMNRERMAVVLESSLHIFDMRSLDCLQTLEIDPNPTGLVALCPNAEERCYLAFPRGREGEVVVYDARALRAVVQLKAHQSAVTCLRFDAHGRFLATASERGTLIRVFSMTGSEVYNFRRGSYSTTIYSIAFDPTASLVAAASGKGTVHVFSMPASSRSPQERQRLQQLRRRQQQQQQQQHPQSSEGQLSQLTTQSASGEGGGGGGGGGGGRSAGSMGSMGSTGAADDDEGSPAETGVTTLHDGEGGDDEDTDEVRTDTRREEDDSFERISDASLEGYDAAQQAAVGDNQPGQSGAGTGGGGSTNAQLQQLMNVAGQRVSDGIRVVARSSMRGVARGVDASVDNISRGLSEIAADPSRAVVRARLPEQGVRCKIALFPVPPSDTGRADANGTNTAEEAAGDPINCRLFVVSEGGFFYQYELNLARSERDGTLVSGDKTASSSKSARSGSGCRLLQEVYLLSVEEDDDVSSTHATTAATTTAAATGGVAAAVVPEGVAPAASIT